MRFEKSKIEGVFLIRLTPSHDERGFLARSWCERECEEHGLNPRLVQCNISFNRAKGTLRGVHYQVAPYAEAKLVRCTQGAIYDVAVDLRPDSPTFRQWEGTVLSLENRNMFYVPEGCGHGFLTLTDDTEVFYQMSEFYHPDSSRGIRWDDPAFGISWPEEIRVISVRDRNYPDFKT